MLNANTCVTCSLVDFPAVQESGELMPEVGSLKPLSNSKVTIFSPCNGTVEEGFYRCIFPFAIWYVLRQSTSKNEKRLGIANLSQLMMKLHKFLRSKLWVIRRIVHQKVTVCCGLRTVGHQRLLPAKSSRSMEQARATASDLPAGQIQAHLFAQMALKAYVEQQR